MNIAVTIAANRFGLGAKPGEIAGIGSDARGWLRAQLTSPPPALQELDLKSTAEVLAAATQLRAVPGAATQGMKLPALYRPLYVAEARARLVHAVRTDRPFLERLTQFWSNHFAVSVDKIAVLGLAGPLEREAIRPNVLGSFHDLLLAVEQHPAMLMYLDNQRSIGPNAAIASRAQANGREIGLNENLAREILELHTLGVDGGYTQADVTSFAKIITGWSVAGTPGDRRGMNDGVSRGFVFRPMLHEPGAQRLLGKQYAQDGEAQGRAALRDLARAPATARHIAIKLARHFIADDPPPAVIVRLTKAYLASDGALRHVYEELLDAREAWSAEPGKFKTPQDYLVSTWRAVQLPIPEGNRALAPLEVLGQRQFAPKSPAGWPDRSSDWDGSSALLKRIEFADALARRLGDTRNARELAPAVLGSALKDATR
ncbi:MAG: DUF1800 domain-containing protein, partial [Steroidobacteraceae bacterium]